MRNTVLVKVSYTFPLGLLFDGTVVEVNLLMRIDMHTKWIVGRVLAFGKDRK
jgi:hypothetical protein